MNEDMSEVYTIECKSNEWVLIIESCSQLLMGR